MNKLLPQAIIVAALALPAMGHAQGTLPIQFDVNGATAGGLYTVDLLDWAPGNALSVGTIAGGGIAPVGTQTQLLYQANLSLGSLAGATQFAPGINSQNFTAVAGFKETIVSNITGLNPTFTFSDAPVLSSTNFFYIYATGATIGNNLTGTGFAAGTLILSGHVISTSSSNFTASPNATNTGPLIDTFDKSGTNNYPGVTTVVGSGATNLTAVIDSVNASYFPTLLSGGTVVFSFFNNSQVTPFQQVDPSGAFSSNGLLDGNFAPSIGTVNGQSGPNFQFQADANQSFTAAVPEPGSLALVGLALGGLGLMGRKAAAKRAPAAAA